MVTDACSLYKWVELVADPRPSWHVLNQVNHRGATGVLLYSQVQLCFHLPHNGLNPQLTQTTIEPLSPYFSKTYMGSKCMYVSSKGIT